ncbi:MAG: hypothetical protein J5706_04675 [Elusimicrobiales bacterium]|nr:hypothetical protein [Elusimicrobiales bacterium]
MSECGQYRNPERGRQLILFDGLQYGDMSPTDIDGILDYKNRIWLIFEAKLADAPMPRGQRLALERLVQDAGEAGKHGIAMVVEHFVYDTDRNVTLANCRVREIYTTEHRRWWPPYKLMTAKEMVDTYVNYYYKEDS